MEHPCFQPQARAIVAHIRSTVCGRPDPPWPQAMSIRVHQPGPFGGRYTSPLYVGRTASAGPHGMPIITIPACSPSYGGVSPPCPSNSRAAPLHGHIRPLLQQPPIPIRYVCPLRAFAISVRRVQGRLCYALPSCLPCLGRDSAVSISPTTSPRQSPFTVSPPAVSSRCLRPSPPCLPAFSLPRLPHRRFFLAVSLTAVSS